MSRSTRSDSSAATRAFAGQAALILLPVVLLAILATAAMKADRRRTELRARELAEVTIRALAQSVTDSLQKSFQDYSHAQREAFPSLPGDPPVPTGLRSWAGGSTTQRDSEVVSATVAAEILPEAIFNTEGELVRPPTYSVAPVPPKWWIDLELDLQTKWDDAFRLEFQGAPHAEIVTAYERCREVVTNYPFDLNVQFALRRLASNDSPAADTESLLTFSVGPRISSPAGLPLAALVLYEALTRLDRTESLTFPTLALSRLGDSVTEFPSILTPRLLELSETITAQNPVARAAVVAWTRRWEADEHLRQLARTITPPNAVTPTVSWQGPSSRRVLMATAPFQWIREESGIRTTNDLVSVTMLNSSAVRALMHSALEANRSLVPNYAAVEVRIASELLSDLGAELPELSQITRPIFDRREMQVPLQLALRLANPEALYADQQRRERWTAVLILGAVFAAIFGVWHAWRTLKHQLELNVQQSNFVSAVSHELRAPLASVRLLAEGLANGQVKEEPRQREYARFLVQETRRLGNLIENVLNFARLDRGRVRYEFAPTDVRRLAQDTVARFAPVAAERQVRLRVDDQLGATAPEPEWDGLAVQQGLSNLLDNALKHAPENSEVTVTITAPAGSPRCVQLVVTDHGPGIPADQQARIFERFYRLGSELRRETRGVGLGLALVKQIAEAHDGRVTVTSTVGQGSTFTLELPVSPATLA